MANESNFTTNSVDGFAIGTNLDRNYGCNTCTAVNRNLKLWKITDGVATSIFDFGSNLNHDTAYEIKVTRDASGTWELFLNDVYKGSENDPGYNNETNYYTGLLLRFNSAARGKLWLDDLSITEIPSIVISEVMYNNLGREDEWIELYNNSGADVDITGWTLLYFLNKTYTFPTSSVITNGGSNLRIFFPEYKSKIPFSIPSKRMSFTSNFNIVLCIYKKKKHIA